MNTNKVMLFGSLVGVVMFLAGCTSPAPYQRPPPQSTEEWCDRAFDSLDFESINASKKQAMLVKMENNGCMDAQYFLDSQAKANWCDKAFDSLDFEYIGFYKKQALLIKMKNTGCMN